MKRNVLFTVLLLLVLAIASVGCKRTAPMQNFGNPGLSAYGYLTDVQVRDAIVRGGTAADWQMSEERPGMLVGVYRVRVHTVTVEIPYTSNSYTIRHRSSINMKAEGGEIHRNYNRWVEDLNSSINAELIKLKK